MKTPAYNMRFKTGLAPSGKWGELRGLVLFALVVAGCASSPAAFRGYLNEPMRPYEDGGETSGAYLASSSVPWCVNLHHPSVSLERARSLRKAFYHAYGKATVPDRRSVVTGAPAGRVEAGSHPSRKATCWSVVEQADGGVGTEVHDRNFIAVTLPGGGSRSAVFSAAVLFELQRQGLLQEIDLISAVSGGSLPAALFARSCEDVGDCLALYGDQDHLLWTPAYQERIYRLLGTDFLGQVMRQMSMPWNLWRYGTSRYDRTDALAAVFAATISASSSEGADFGMTFRQLNPRRPNLLINATNATGERLGPGLKGQHFVFSLETFEQSLHSNLHDYPLAFAVAGSSAFPGALYPITLAAYPNSAAGHDPNVKPLKYRHIIDGGVYDRLGGEAIRLALGDLAEREEPCARPARPPRSGDDEDCIDHMIAIVLDSGLPVEGEDATRPEPRRTGMGFSVDENIVRASFALLDIQAELRLDSLRAFAHRQNVAMGRGYGLFQDVFRIVDIRLRDLEQCVEDPLPCSGAEGFAVSSAGDAAQMYRELWGQVSEVPLSLRITEESVSALRRAARILVQRKLLAGCPREEASFDCTPPDHGPRPVLTGLDPVGSPR